ncbi:MAG: regulatory iron-sulfur-containing complex subunit RicT [Candidatus Atribacteria bacterium]|nr:regulatory iron-sulfur-containing complex subunit RicT [Candidatus Atribacteria bacterium]
MPRVVGIKFEYNLKMYYFDARNIELHLGNECVVETVLGMEMGQVVKKPGEVENIKGNLKPVLRVAERIDHLQLELNLERERQAFKIARDKIAFHKLPMKLLRTHYTLDRGRLTFYFGSEERIDFRNLVKDLAAIFRTRIELRQMGVRDEAGMIGGCGMCGKELCCSTFLINFEPISIKMAKEQNLALNSAKISGVCGRLMCCLSFEYSQYKKLLYHLPKKGSKIVTPRGLAKIVEVDIFKDLIRLELEDGKEISINEEEYSRFFL